MPAPKKILDQEVAYDLPATYRLFVEDEFRWAYDPSTNPTLQEVIDDILGHLTVVRADGLNEWDLCVWQACRVVAVIRTAQDGQPRVNQFK